MGRIFETRKHTMFARWNKMAKAFTRVSKDIAIAVKSGGGSADSNPALRRVIQNARALNMPMEKVDSAIKRACGEDVKAYDVVVYEGYAPHGIALLVETATDNVTRTVANVRSIFKKQDGNFGASGSVAFMFSHMGVFRIAAENVKDAETLELELIDFGLEEMGESTSEKGDKQVVIRCAFKEFGKLQAALEERKIDVVSAESEYIAQNHLELTEAQATQVLELVDALEQDEDVQKVFHNLA